MKSERQPALLLSGLIVIAFVWTIARSGPLHNSSAALVLTVLVQVWLPGYLVARAAGRHRHPHPITRLAWVLAGGIALPVVLGGVARLFNLPVFTYLLILHGVMLALAWLPPSPAPDAPAWKLTRRNLPLLVLVALACGVVLTVSNSTRHRFYGFEDQVIFVSHAGWLANNPGETPTGGPLRTRQVGVNSRDTRFDTDGWTYNHAAWVWTSGVSATDLIWYGLDPLFVWAVPLAVFALAHEITRREEAAAWSAAAVALAGILTLDNIAHYPGYTAFGRLAVLQMSTLRQFSIALMLPLTLMIGFAALRSERRRDLWLMLLAGAALAIFHPFQITLFVLSLGVTAALRWLVSTGKGAALRRLIPLGLALVVLLALPFIQRLNRSGLGAADTLIDEEVLESAEGVVTRSEFLILPDVPLVGSTYIRSPERVFYHPVMVLAVVFGLLHGLGLRRSLTAQYLFGTTALFLLLSFTPGLTELFNKFASSVGLLTTLFILPVALALGHSLDAALRWLAGRIRHYPTWVPSALLIAAGALLLFEPVPVPASARDQIHSYREMQQFRRLQPAHSALSQRLQSLIPPQQTSVFMAPSDTASIVIEDLPRTLVTGGRGSGNQARFGDNRFYNQLGAQAPWLDSADLDFMATYGVTHIISRADHTRLPQMLLQPERFALLDEVAGQLVFARSEESAPDAIDALYAQMNALYAETPQPRWGPGGFEMPRPGSPEIWGPLAEAWQQQLEDAPDNDRARLGLAYARLMMGADADALPLWAQLHDAYPAVAFYADALAYTHAALGQPQQGAVVLLAALESDDAAARVLAARTLLTETFFYLLTADQIDAALAAVQSDTWHYLVFFDQPDQVRQRAALLMGAQRWQMAAAWLDYLPNILHGPRDIAAQGMMLLALGDIEGALARLQPASDPDWRAGRAFWQPDRWANNAAEQLYYLLLGDVAMRDGRADDARTAYQQAIDAGAQTAGDYFLTQATGTPPPDEVSLVPLLAVAEQGNPFVLLPQVAQDEDAATLTVTAAFGSPTPHGTYPVRTWRVEIIDPETATLYTSAETPAQFAEAALRRESITLPLPDDVPPLTPALVVITPLHNTTVTYPPALVPVTLNRPASATPPADAAPVGVTFGDAIRLESYTLSASAGQLDLTLYWQAGQPLTEDYQVFVHVLDASGEIIAQDDGAPVQGRYPTSRWRAGVTIADPHTIALPADLPAGYHLRLGLYRLPEGTRLPISPAEGARIDGDSLLIDDPQETE